MAIISTKEMFKKAYANHYAVGAFNINNMEIIQGVTEAAAEEKSPVILQVSAGARKYAKPAYLMALAKAACEDAGIDFALHLDHGDSFELCKDCIDNGFSSVMIDGSKYSFEDNIALTKKVVEYAHAHGIVVDSLAIAIGTSHGAFKFKGEPKLRFDILEEISRRLPEFPIVLHGASSVNQEYVKVINENGGNLADAKGVPEELLRKAATMAVCKINIDSDIRLACTAAIREVFCKDPAIFDPRLYLGPARENVKKLVKHKIKNVLGSSGMAD